MVPARVIGSLIAVTLAHLLLVALAVREGRTVVADPAADRTAAGLECSTCGATNRPEYRYCRRCVSRLPGAHSALGGADRPSGRRTL